MVTMPAEDYFNNREVEIQKLGSVVRAYQQALTQNEATAGVIAGTAANAAALTHGMGLPPIIIQAAPQQQAVSGHMWLLTVLAIVILICLVALSVYIAMKKR